MKRWPKYIVLPVALLIYFVAMAIYGIRMNNGELPDRFGLIVTIELVVLVALFWLLKRRSDLN